MPLSNGSARRVDDGDEFPVTGCRVDLQAAEVELLLKACQKYRSSLPGYLQSVKDDMELADKLVDKLRRARASF